MRGQRLSLGVRGFTLVEIILVMGLLSILGLQIAKMTLDSGRAARSATDQMAFDDLINRFRLTMSAGSNCTDSLSGLLAFVPSETIELPQVKISVPPAGTNPERIFIQEGPVSGTSLTIPVGGIVLTGFKLLSPAVPNGFEAQIRVTANKNMALSIGAPVLVASSTLSVTTKDDPSGAPGAKLIDSCDGIAIGGNPPAGGDADLEGNCLALGGTWSSPTCSPPGPETFEAAGSFTYTVPDHVRLISVSILGGGGGGGAGKGEGGEGGGAGQLITQILPVMGGDVFSVTIGNGGAGAWSTSNCFSNNRCMGRPGQPSRFGALSATGGKAGGVGDCTYWSFNQNSCRDQLTCFCPTNPPNIDWGRAGGSSIWGVGGAIAPNVPHPGTGFGSGGSGGADNYLGAVGTLGKVRVEHLMLQ